MLLNRLQSIIFKNVYFTDQNIMQRGDPMEMNFEGLGMQKWNAPTVRVQIVNKKWGHLSSYNVYSRRSFSCTFMLCPNCHQQKINKSAIFDFLITITLEVNMITRQMDPLFHLAAAWYLFYKMQKYHFNFWYFKFSFSWGAL